MHSALIGDVGRIMKVISKTTSDVYKDAGVIESISRVFQDNGYHYAVEMIIKLEEEEANKEYINFLGHGHLYLEVNKPNEAMDWIEKAIEIKQPGTIIIGTKSFNLEPVKDNSRFLELLEKINLPLPEN